MPATEAQMQTHDAAVKKHVKLVRKNGRVLIKEFLARLKEHDLSKLESPEREVYGEHFEKLGQVEYGSPEYVELLKAVKPATDNHYAKNRHHPEHWPHGIDDMDLVDILEMIADWTASVKKNKNGNIHKSIALNTERYKISPQMVQILTNTVERYLS